MQHPSIVKSSNWNLPKQSQISFEFVSYNYLHCNAEEICGYDCIEANFDFCLRLLSLRMFPSNLLLQNGTMVDVVVMPYVKDGKVTSLICLCDDYEGITNALFNYDKDKKVNITMYDEEENFLFEKYPPFKEIYKKYNYHRL
jgi:hypothetical protein